MQKNTEILPKLAPLLKVRLPSQTKIAKLGVEPKTIKLVLRKEQTAEFY